MYLLSPLPHRFLFQEGSGAGRSSLQQCIGVLSGVGGWVGIGLAAGITESKAGPSTVGAYEVPSRHTQPGGTLTVFTMPK